MLTSKNEIRNNIDNLANRYLFYLDNVSVSFKKIHALTNISFSVNPGEILFITGASGAGKSTLLRVLSGEVKSNKGKFFKKDIRGKKTFIAQVFQDLKLINGKTCEDNLWLAYDKKIYKNKNEFHKDMKELAQYLGAWDYLHVKMKDANGGLKQKIAIIRALLSKPDVLLADEPTCSMDKDNAVKVFEILNFYNTKKGLTVIWASHNRELVKQFPGKIAHLENGKLVYSGHACFI